ncbi:MAG: L-threonylcarbamoyladenylate synthase [Ostreibacterium sp.]
MSEKQLAKTKQVIASSGVICYPTEALWGLGCHPQSEVAFKKILTLKQRPLSKGVILIASDITQLMPYVILPNALKKKLSHYWPGFVTCVLPKSSECPDYLTGNFNSIAVRLTAYPIVKELCRATATALVSTSANISEREPVATINVAKAVFGRGVDYYVNAPLGGAEKPSRIIDCTHQTLTVIRR